MSNTEIIFSRLSRKDNELIKKVCELRRERISDFVRDSVMLRLAELGYLETDAKKALGVGGERT